MSLRITLKLVTQLPTSAKLFGYVSVKELEPFLLVLALLK